MATPLIVRPEDAAQYRETHILFRDGARVLCWPKATRKKPVYREHRPVRPMKGGTTLEAIMRAVCAAFRTEQRWVCSQRRNRKHIEPRLAFYLLAEEFSDQSLPTIGRFVCRDHTTVMHGVKRARQVLADNPEFAMNYETAKRIVERKIEASVN